MADRAKQVETSASPTKGVLQKPDPIQQTHASGLGTVLQPRSARVQRTLSGPADILPLQQTIGNQAVMRLLDKQRPAVQAKVEESPEEESVQRLGEGQREPSDAEIHSAAARGVSTPATTLPFLDRIQASFGRHSIGHIKAHVGPAAAEASRAMNARAFASGDHVVFGGTPDLHTTAHEAAHVVQQQAGVQLAGRIGRKGDAYECHADAVANMVVAGRSVEGFLSSLSSLPTADDLGVSDGESRVLASEGKPLTQLSAVQRGPKLGGLIYTAKAFFGKARILTKKEVYDIYKKMDKDIITHGSRIDLREIDFLEANTETPTTNYMTKYDDEISRYIYFARMRKGKSFLYGTYAGWTAFFNISAIIGKPIAGGDYAAEGPIDLGEAIGIAKNTDIVDVWEIQAEEDEKKQ